MYGRDIQLKYNCYKWKVDFAIHTICVIVLTTKTTQTCNSFWEKCRFSEIGNPTYAHTLLFVQHQLEGVCVYLHFCERPLRHFKHCFQCFTTRQSLVRWRHRTGTTMTVLFSYKHTLFQLKWGIYRLFSIQYVRV